MDTTKAIHFKNPNIVALANWLSGLALTGRDSRERTKFLRTVVPHIQEYEKARLEIAKKFAKKDSNGNPVTIKVGDDERYDFEPENIADFQKEVGELMSEETVIDVLPSNTENLKRIIDIVLNTEETFAGKDAVWYDEVCETLEKVNL